jgi:RNA polymerase-interacting CarD/CdnL/TRCF family regulator
MTGFEEKIKGFLVEQGVLRDLWQKSVKRAKEYEEEENEIFETSRGYFEDEIAIFVYEWVRKIEGKEVEELLEEALNDMDFYDLTNDIVLELNLRVEE